MRFFELLFNNISGKLKALIILVSITLVGVAIAFWQGGVPGAIVIGGILCFTFYITKAVWLPADHGKTLIRRISISAILILSGSFGYWNALASSFLNPLLSQIFEPYVPEFNSRFPGAPSFLIICISMLTILAINYLLRDKTVAGTHPNPIDIEFPEKDFRQQLLYYVRNLENELNNIDLETNWNDYFFTPLEAEVEVDYGNQRIKKVTDLMKAIKSDRRTKVFLLLGDPGSGKSITLRKFAKSLLREVEKTGRIPIYVNLKEWKSNTNWTIDSPPKIEELYNFIYSRLLQRGDIFSRDFLEKYFKKMYEHGRIYFILDSFDEIPEILDANESSWIIDELSDLLYKFLGGSHESRGILSSRIFRRPSRKFKAKTILEIRPFTLIRARLFFQKMLGADKAPFVNDFFKQRPDLSSIARNPFTASLLSRFIKENNFSLPKNQNELYRNYIQSRLGKLSGAITDKNLTVEEIMNFCTNLANFILISPNWGIEINLNQLGETQLVFSKNQIESIVEILVIGKIARVSVDKNFSFVHRRFFEFFVVNYFLQNPEKINLQTIPTDSQWRDALVLYCEVSPDDEALKIAKFCLREAEPISKNDLIVGSSEYYTAIHCLRFFVDAFKFNPKIRENEEISQIISKILEVNQPIKEKPANDGDEIQIEDKSEVPSMILKTKIKLECAIFLESEQREVYIGEILSTGNFWLSETIIKSANNILYSTQQLSHFIKFNYLNSLDLKTFIKSAKELNFIFSLFDEIKSLTKFLLLKKIDAAALFIGVMLIFLDFLMPFGNKRGELTPVISVGLILCTYILESLGLSSLIKSIVFGRKNPAGLEFNFESVFRLGLPLIILFVPLIFQDMPDVFSNKSNNHLHPNFITVLGLILILPFYSIATFFISFSFKEKYGRIGIGILFLGAIILGMRFFILFILQYKDILEKYAPFILIPFFLFLFLYFIFQGIFLVKDLITFKKQKHFLNLLDSETTITKEWFVQQIANYATEYYCTKFIQYFDSLEIVPTGALSNEEIISNKNIDIKILIAKLEEKWLDLLER